GKDAVHAANTVARSRMPLKAMNSAEREEAEGKTEHDETLESGAVNAFAESDRTRTVKTISILLSYPARVTTKHDPFLTRVDGDNLFIDFAGDDLHLLFSKEFMYNLKGVKPFAEKRKAARNSSKQTKTKKRQ